MSSGLFCYKSTRCAAKSHVSERKNGPGHPSTLVGSIEWEPVILDITVHLVDVSAIDPGEAADVTSIAGRYASRAADENLPISSRREAAGVGYLLRDVFGVFDDAQLVRSAFGKMELVDGNAPAISISHGGDAVILAASSVVRSIGGPIGTDIESTNDISPLAVSRMACDEERAWIDAAVDQQERRFRMCQVWTRIEAILKAEGTGFSTDPRKDGMPVGWVASSVSFGDSVISCAARSTPHIVIKEHAFRVA